MNDLRIYARIFLEAIYEESVVLQEVPFDDLLDNFIEHLEQNEVVVWSDVADEAIEWVQNTEKEVLSRTLMNMASNGIIDMGIDERGEMVFGLTKGTES